MTHRKIQYTLLTFLSILLFTSDSLAKGRDNGLMYDSVNKTHIKFPSNRLPLSPIFFKGKADSLLLSAYIHAANRINRIANRKIFILKHHNKINTLYNEQTVFLIEYDRLTNRRAGTLEYVNNKDGYIVYFRMKIDRDLSFPQLKQVMLHELMHVLGFDHDTKCTVMYHANEPKCNVISEKDKRIIRALYGKAAR